MLVTMLVSGGLRLMRKDWWMDGWMDAMDGVTYTARRCFVLLYLLFDARSLGCAKQCIKECGLTRREQGA